MQAGKHSGKLALTRAPTRSVPSLLKSQSKTQLRPTATYLLVGGLGGVGHSIAHLLADMGARHISFLSRSGATTTSAVHLLDELQRRGVRASAYKGDVSDKLSLQRALMHCTGEHPPVCGVVQCAMVLHDISLEKMSHE